MSVKLLTENHLEFLSLKGGCTGLSESKLVKMPHRWQSRVTAHMKLQKPCGKINICFFFFFFFFFWGGGVCFFELCFLQFDSLIRWVQLLFEEWLYQNFEGNLLPLVIFKGGGGPDPLHPHPSGSANERGNKVKQALVPKWTSAVLFTRHIGLCVIFDRAYPGSEFVVANTLAKGAK